MVERRYEPILKLAAGGMATVFVGTARGAMGFRQLVALKRPHPHLLEDPSYRRELVAEARLASLIHHANVVDVRDIEIEGDEITLVMDYIEGASLAELLNVGLRGGAHVPPAVSIRIVLDACAGLHAAHDLVDEKGRTVGVVHRDVSPQNLLVGIDGTTRVTDFGVAKLTSGQSTAHGTLKGKIAYMAPEYLKNERIDRRLDVFALGVVLWEALTYERLFRGEHDADTLRKILEHRPRRISDVVPSLGTELDSVLETALYKDPEKRFANALAFSNALEASAHSAGLVATHADVAAVVSDLMGKLLEARRVEVRKKMAEEPSLLSFMKGEQPPEVAALGKVNPDLVVTAGPATTPTIDTLPLERPTAPVPTTLPLAHRSSPPVAAVVPSTISQGPISVDEPSRNYDPMSISQLPSPPKRSLAMPIALTMIAVVAIGGAATWAATRPADVTTTPSTTASAEPAPSVTATASASASTSALAPLPSHSTHIAHSPPHPSASTRASAAPRASDDPPPNPY